MTDAPPIPGARVERATDADAAELLVLQRCCWVDEALANDTLDIPAFHESLDDVRSWIATWSTWCVRLDGRVVGAVRAHHDGASWDIGRLMVAPDLAGRGLGRWLLAFAEAQAPDDVEQLVLFTGAREHSQPGDVRAGRLPAGADAGPAGSGRARQATSNDVRGDAVASQIWRTVSSSARMMARCSSAAAGDASGSRNSVNRYSHPSPLRTSRV